MNTTRQYNQVYSNENLNHVAFPLGGIGAGMICLEGTGALSHVSVRNQPDIFNEPLMFSALCVVGEENMPRVLEGPVPTWKIFGPAGTGNGGNGKGYGLPHCTEAQFLARFPFATVVLSDPRIPLKIEITGWSPFIPGDADNSSLPVAELEYHFVNTSEKPIEAVYSFHARNFMSTDTPGASVQSAQGGFMLQQPGSAEKPWNQGSFSAVVDDPEVKVNCAWFRGGGYDPLTMVWKTIAEGASPQSGPITEGNPSPGGSLYVPFMLEPAAEKTIQLRLAWYVPKTNIRVGKDPGEEKKDSCCSTCCDKSTKRETYIPWYAGRFSDIEAVNSYWKENIAELQRKSAIFSNCFYDTSLPDEVVEAVAANLTILKSPTILRQTDGRLWGWEGCCDGSGCCAGSCTHVWNYAQALPHLFTDLEQTLRETEFNENQDDRGHQTFRASLPIRPTAHDFHAAADGQLGGIMKVYREWRICGNSNWMRSLWPRVRKSLEYCIETWDPEHKGVLTEPHHNTYDIEFWGPDGMCTSFYMGALQAAVAMGQALGDDVLFYEELLQKGRRYMEERLFDGEYFCQDIQWKDLRAKSPLGGSSESAVANYSPEAVDLLEREGPKYQYGEGCLSDGVLGTWMAEVCGLDPSLDRRMIESHILAVHKHNFRTNLSEHANPQRPTFAVGNEGGLLLCSWPKGAELSLPFIYSNEVWTGIEYQVASHLMMTGHVQEGLQIVRAVRDRYDGRVRNPFNEYECGHWYARAMSSYALIQGMTGIRYDAADKVLYIKPRIKDDFRAFLSTATGFGTVGVRDGEPFIEVKYGTINVKRMAYKPNHSRPRHKG